MAVLPGTGSAGAGSAETVLRTEPSASVVTSSSPGAASAADRTGAPVGGAGDRPAAGQHPRRVEGPHLGVDGASRSRSAAAEQPRRPLPQPGRGGGSTVCSWVRRWARAAGLDAAGGPVERRGRPAERTARPPAPPGRRRPDRSRSAATSSWRVARATWRPHERRRSASVAGGPAGRGDDAAPAVVGAGLDGADVGHHGLGAGGRRLVGGVGDLVGHRAVDLVADAGEHRDVERGDGPGDDLAVEGGQVGGGAAAPHQQHDVDPAGGDRPQAPRPPTGAPGRPAPARRRCTTEKPMPDRRSSSSTSCSAALPAAGDQADPQRQRAGRGRAACRASRPSPSSRRSSRSRSAASRPSVKAGSMSDICSCRRPPRSYQVDPAPDPHLGAVGHAHPAAGVGQPGVDPAAGGVEQHDRQAGERRPAEVAVGRGLDQVEPDGAAPPAGVEVADLAPHPQLVGERGAHAAARWPRPARGPTRWGRPSSHNVGDVAASGAPDARAGSLDRRAIADHASDGV